MGEGADRADAARLEQLGYAAHFDRTMSLWQNFALGFTYLSPVVGVYSVFALSLRAAGPPMIWSYLIAGAGQMLVCLVFSEVVAEFPISGGLYPWTRRLVGRRWAWMAGWIYAWALFTSIAGVALGAGPFLADLLGFAEAPRTDAAIALALVAAATLLNLRGTRLLGHVAMFGFVCELIGALAVGFWLLLLHRHNGPGILLRSFGAGHGGWYLPAFLAGLTGGLFCCYGFEACADVAEEVPAPGRTIPVAMRRTIVVGMAAALFVCFALLLAVPDIRAVTLGRDANPVGSVLRDAFGGTGARLVIAVVMVSFLSCVLSLQAAASRLLHAYGRDAMIFGSAALTRISDGAHVPWVALLASGGVPAAIVVLGLFMEDAIATVINFAVAGIYLAFQMVVVAALHARWRGWRPRGAFTLGRAGLPVNLAALAYGAAALLDIVWPHNPDQPWLTNHAVLVAVVLIVGVGLAYLLLARPHRGGNAPAADAWRRTGPSD